MALDPARAHDRRWWTLGVLCLSLTVIGVDNTILNVSLPSIVRSLDAHGSQLQWIIDAYTIVFACLLLTAGTLGDRFGRKGALTAGLVCFGAFSALASTSTSATMLIISRGLMGIGGALIFPTTLSILTNTFTGHERAKAIGIWAGVSGLGIVIGPLAGGILVEHFYWGSVFLVNVPLCLAAIVLGHYLVPTSKDPEDGKLDLVGAVLSIVALSGILYAIIEAPDLGWTSNRILFAAGVGLGFVGLFAWWESHTEQPMLDVRFFRNPRFSAASGTITLVYFALFGSTFLLTQYFQFVLGYSPLEAGLLTAPVAVALMIVSPNAPKLARRYGTKKTVVGGLFFVMVGLLMYSVPAIIESLGGGILSRLMFGVGIGLVSAPATESIMGSLPLGKAGVGSAVNDTTRQTGGALGVAIIGSIFAARYHSLMASAPLPVGAEAARDSIGRALESAATLPADQAASVRQLADAAYVSGARVAFTLAALVIVAAMGVAWRWLPAHASDDGELEMDLDALEHLAPVPAGD